ncbi:hypothetical protein DB41_AU00040 [Neochlamydia sp. TUME1]|uniref:SWIM zinc finger family protein n=1 Tax=Neochlamydia sp. TUME1 TaxID=1478174 RepID=UPI00057C60FF|nr:SWIM zinc finger family protein [Neochlamydia sp. TUME1]KIC71623.1 hypothetical protein DB41_AU00040 [Neochlamydia sp. TUME1]
MLGIKGFKTVEYALNLIEILITQSKIMIKNPFYFNEAMIKEWCFPNTFLKGENYIEKVTFLTIVADTLYATVQGSLPEPYQVKVSLKNQQWQNGYCSCPSDFYPCKHLVAVLLKIARQGIESFGPPLEEILRTLDLSTLRSLLLRLIEQHPYLVKDIQIFLIRPVATGEPTSLLDTQAIAREMEDLLYQDYDFWDDEGEGLSEIALRIEELMRQVIPFLEAEDGVNAFAILKAITKPLIERNETFIDFGGDDLYEEILDALASLWMEAILISHFSSKEKTVWTELFYDWNEESDGAFNATLELMKAGWDYPLLKAALTNQTDFATELDEEVSKKIARVAFRVLKRQKKLDTCLLLAHLAGMDEEYAKLLIELKRYIEAERFINSHIRDPNTLLKLSQQFYECKELQLALKTALCYKSSREEGWLARDLLRWTRDLAFEAGQIQIGIKAGVDLLTMASSLEDYKALQKGAQSQWDIIKPGILKFVQIDRAYNHEEPIKILLYEKMIDEAIKIAEKFRTMPEFLIEEALTQRPEWALENCQKLATEAIQHGASYYDRAAGWLDKAYLAATQAQSIAQWTKNIRQLLKEHQRKRNLVPKLKELLTKHNIDL